MEDCCAVCAEPLDWVAYGPCGHKDACSKCVTRLRFVLNDLRCVICQQSLMYVFITRFMGTYTKLLSVQEFQELKPDDRQSRYRFLKAADAFFDDRRHFEEMRELCSYTHPALSEVRPDGETQQPHFKSLGALKKAVQTNLQLQFCNICLESRKVFIPEQVLYTKADFFRHQKTGDIEGAMAESGFRGHPLCRFCNRHFFGENELFNHMQQSHEQCHICKKANPDRFIYYKDYDELEEHFRHEHYLCGHTSCLEKKFVVFPSEQELKQHTAKEHAGGMSRAERRQALTIPIDITYSRDRGDGAAPRGRSRGGPIRFREPDPNHVATALQESIDSAARHRDAIQREAESRQQGESTTGGRVVLDDSNFPSMGNLEAPSFGPGFGAFAHRTAPRPEDFPALPGTSKSAKKRAKEKEKEQEARSLASRVGRQAEVRVISSGGQASNRSGRGESFPALGAAAPSAPQRASQWQPTPAPRPAAVAPNPAGDFPSLPQQHKSQLQLPNFEDPSTARSQATEEQLPAKVSQAARPTPAEFPALGRSAASEQLQGGRGLGTSSSGSGGISEALKAANKVLVEKVKRQLDAKRFGEFRQSVAAFMRSDIDARTYYKTVEAIGLSHLIPEMASLLPDPSKRAALLSAYEAALTTPSSRYIPPEAAAAALKSAKGHGSWECPTCTLINEPRAANCEACTAKRPLQSLGSLARSSPSPTLGNGGAAEANQNPMEGKSLKKGSKFERLRLTSGGQEGGLHAEMERRTKPQNVWTQRQSLAQAVAPAPQKGVWNNEGGGKLVSSTNIVQTGWPKK